jgi:PAS domain S-box-containing protein
MPVAAGWRVFASILVVIFGVEIVVLRVLPPTLPLDVDVVVALSMAILSALLLWLVVAKPLAMGAEAERLRREARVAHIVQGSVDGILTTDARGVTERRRADQELRTSEQRYRSLFANMLDGFAHCRMVYDEHDRPVDFVYLSVNAAFERLTGLTNVVGKRVSEVIPGIRELSPELFETYGRVASTGVPESFEFDFKSRDQWLTISVYRPEEGSFVAVFDDITARQRSAAQLRASERRFTSLFESAPDAILIMNRHGTITQVNRHAERMFGWSRAELIGQPTEMLMPQLMRKGHVALHEGYLRDDASHEMGGGGLILHGVRKDGKEFPVEISLSPMDFDGDVFVAAAVRDITERTQLQAQLRQAQKMESVGRLAGGVAHDFNNLLSVIIGWTEMAMAELPAGHPIRPELQEVLGAGQGAADLTQQLLAFSRQQVVKPVSFNVNALVVEMDKMLRRLLGEDVDLTSLPDPDLGTVKMDRGQLHQVLMNLAVNARDAMPSGGKLTIETANVVLDAEYPRTHADVTPGDYVMLAVSDSGTGMSEDVKAHLFEPFFTTKEPGKGTGLGLATSYGIVKQAGGHLEVYSEQGVGTTMKVYLPRTREAAEAVQRAPRATPSQGAETILLVEDEPAVRLVIVRMLETRGYRVVSASSGAEALRVIEEEREPLHLLLTDVVLAGGMSGPVLAERVRALRPDLKVLFASGYTSDVTLLHGLLEQGIALVQKPFMAESLGEKVRQVLDAE